MSIVIDYLRGFLQIEIKGANPEEMLNVCVKNGVSVYDCASRDDFTLLIRASRRDEARIHALAARAGCESKTLRQRGAPFFLRSIRGRIALFAGLFLTLALLLFSSLHIWEIKVSGNEEISTSKILRALEEIDISAGYFWPGMAIERVRNLVLARIPELSFLSVNIYGSRAEVIVRERSPVPEIYDEDLAVNVIASRGGIISEIRAYSGETRVLSGQTVLPGELLVSGAVNSFKGMRALHARADVYARTWYEISAISPLTEEQKAYTGESKTRYALCLGGARINFYGGTGISGPSCDKIISERALSIEGVFTLPVKLISERFEEYEKITLPLDPESVGAELEEALMAELTRRLDGQGETVSVNFTRDVRDGAVYVTLRAECLENIAVERGFTEDELAEIERLNMTENEAGEDDQNE